MSAIFPPLIHLQALSGVLSAYVAAWVLGPVAAVGFAVGSCCGFIASTIYYWRTTHVLAMTSFDQFPQLMMHHLIRNYRNCGFEKVKMKTEHDKEAFKGRLEGNLGLRCQLMAAWHTAAPAIDVS